MKLKKAALDERGTANETKQGGAFISARHRNPVEAQTADDPNEADKIGGICALVATVLLGIIVFMLYNNWELIKSA